MTLLAIIGLKILAGFKWCVANWHIALAGLGAIVLAVAFFKVCGYVKKKPSVNQEQVNTINNANERERKAELQKIVQDNQDTVQTVDQSTAIQNVTVTERYREIDKKVYEADKKVMEAKSQGRDVTQDELQCILVPSDCK